MDIVVNSKTDCPYCVKAKEWLNERNITYTLRVFDDYDDRQAMYDELGLEGNQRTVPQIVVDGVRIGGYSDLLNSDVADRASINFDVNF